MKLQLVIIHMDMVIDNLSLKPGEYSIGRSASGNIVVQHFSLHGEHGKILLNEGTWFYQDLTTKKMEPINDNQSIELSSHISIATNQYVENEKTHISDFSTVHKKRRVRQKTRLAIVSALAVSLLLSTIIGYNYFRTGTYPTNPNNLLQQVRGKIVEFELNRDSKAIEQLKTYSGLKDKDFKLTNGFCTGFLVAKNVVLTASHCVFGTMVIDLTKDFHLKTSDGKSHKVKSILGFDVKRDYLYLETEGMESYGFLEFAPNFKIEQKVFTVGNVHGEGIAIRDGIISSETTDLNDPDVKYIRYSAGASPGNSGGPLLDEFGRIVALVFAGTWTENFNLGTSAEDLKIGFDKYVVDGQKQETQDIKIQMKKILNFNPQSMLQALSLPYLTQFNGYPEVTEQFNDVSIDVTVPLPLEKADEEILSRLNKEVIKTYFEVQKILKQKNEITLDWESFLTKKTPAILPSQMDFSQNSFVKIKDRYYPKLSGLIDSPSKADFSKYLDQLKKEKKFDFQSYGYNILQTDKSIGLIEGDVFYKPKDSSGNKLRLQSLSQGIPYSQLLVSAAGKKIDMALFLKNFLGEQGVISGTNSSFVRPNSMRDFTLRNIDLKEVPKVAKVKDLQGRVWSRSSIQLFEATHIYTYCLDLPEGALCIGRIFNIANGYLKRVIENNFRKFVLSHLLVNPYFWEKEKLMSFYENKGADQMRSMKGLGFSRVSGKVWVNLKGFPLQIQLPHFKAIESIRVQTGLFGSKEKNQWAGYGVEWVEKGEKGDQLCGAGLEPFKTQSNFILNYLRDRRKQEKLKKIKGDDPDPLPKIWYRPVKKIKKPFQIYGYCAPLKEDPRVDGSYFVNFKEAKSLKINYKLEE